MPVDVTNKYNTIQYVRTCRCTPPMTFRKHVVNDPPVSICILLGWPSPPPPMLRSAPAMVLSAPAIIEGCQNMEWSGTGSIHWINNPVQSRWVGLYCVRHRYISPADSGLDWIKKCIVPMHPIFKDRGSFSSSNS